MTGPEHYEEAERTMTARNDLSTAERLAAAQVHATLALVAAIVVLIPEQDPQGNTNNQILNEWAQVGVL